MSILDRSALEESPLADLHAIASELGLDGYRRLRKSDLIDAIVARQGGDASGEVAESEAPDEGAPAETEDEAAVAPGAEDETEPSGGRRRRGRRGGRGRSRDDDERAAEPDAEDERPTRRAAEDERPARRGADGARATRRGAAGERPARRGADGERATRRGAGDERPTRRGVEDELATRRGDGEDDEATGGGEGEAVIDGVVEVLPNGSAFVRVSPPDPSDDDVYISAAQVKRCELVSGDRIAGPRRTPRRSERFASLVRVDTINGAPASEVADTARFDDLPAGFATERFRLGSEDPTLKAIEFLTPFGRGSRVAIVGRAQAGKTEALRLIAAALAGVDDAQVLLVLTGVRPEEISDWTAASTTPAPAIALSASASSDAQAQAVERIIDQGRRLAARGNHVVVLIDSLAGLAPSAARRALASARRIVDGGSLTVIATAPEPIGGETTVIRLDAGLTAARRFPAIDLISSWTMRPELLVGEGGAELIVQTRAEALEA